MKKNTSILFIFFLAAIFFYSCEKDVFTGIVESEVFNYTKIFIDSDPPNSRIYVDGKNMGQFTPDTIKWLDEGTHTVILKNEFFTDTSFTVVSKLDLPASVKIDYRASSSNYGRIECRTLPVNASVYINGEKKSEVTDCIITGIFAGKYKVRFSLPEHRDDSVDAAVFGGRLTRIYRVLEDTSKFVIFNKTNTNISTNDFKCVYVDSKDHKWFGFQDGVFKYDNNKFENVSALNSVLSSKHITCLEGDNFNNLWIGTDNGLFSFNGSAISDYSSQVNYNNINDIEVDANNLWVATNNGLFKYNGSTWQNFTIDNSGLSSNTITSISATINGDLWLGTKDGGIVKLSGGNWTIYNMDNMNLPERAGNSINDLTADEFGNVWAAHKTNPTQDPNTTELGGLTKFDGTAWKIISISGISSKYIEKLYSDNQNNLWICTKEGLGKYSISDNSFKAFTTLNSKLPHPQINGCYIDAKLNLWISTGGGGIMKMKYGNY